MEQRQPSSSVTINFSDDSSGGGSSAGMFLELDEEKNANKTEFFSDEAAFLLFHSDSTAAYTIAVNAGECTTVATRIPKQITELISFINTNRGTLKYLPTGNVSYRWVGAEGSRQPLFSGKDITIQISDNAIFTPAAYVRILECTYDVFCDRLKLTVPESKIKEQPDGRLEVTVVVLQDGATASLAVGYGEEGPGKVIFKSIDIAYKNVVLTIVDFETKEPVPDATVKVNGAGVGKTGTDGKISLGSKKSGTQCTLLITKVGYLDSDKDVLYNDAFTVP